MKIVNTCPKSDWSSEIQIFFQSPQTKSETYISRWLILSNPPAYKQSLISTDQHSNIYTSHWLVNQSYWTPPASQSTSLWTIFLFKYFFFKVHFSELYFQSQATLIQKHRHWPHIYIYMCMHLIDNIFSISSPTRLSLLKGQQDPESWTQVHN